ncbi:NAD-dependent epimerase/dehydratase family protein [Echinicola marina]|uniref:NAD-dependent epimerase/dehydratase family protein n=1 Tax=Echinicola marina TaxID=2859768 RepID=UPI001CF65039|nr:NAD-dependent epimerase/dehydratase family protein [Echinicola marina]UCS93631.1 NAD-dependent epimerase/dehydratase family protein [Echinicola marina]
MQTILGSGGIIGTQLAQELTTYTKKIRLVSRHPKLVNTGDEVFPANLLDIKETQKALNGSSIAYLTIGFPYKTRIWQEAWPKIMNNVIKTCSEQNIKLVFFDNVYMYDTFHIGHMTESTPVLPVSKKGKVRALIAEKLMEATAKKKLNALIARSADFYGPSTPMKSIMTEMVFKPLSKGKSAKWFGNSHCPHSFTYTPDAGKATAMLGNTPDAFNQVWHLPTAPNPPSGKEWIHMVAKEMSVSPHYQTIPKWIFNISEIFVPFMRELNEMLYQYEQPYVFDSKKFEELFFFKPTSYLEGIRRIIKKDYRYKAAQKDDLLFGTK